MRRNRNRRDLLAVLMAAGSIALAVGVVIILKRLGLHDNQAIVVVMLLLPLLVYGIVSGRLKELRAPGGWGATFSRTAEKRITPSDLTTVETIAVGRQFKMPAENELKLHPNALKVVVENSKVRIPICAYLKYVESLLAAEIVRYVIFEDISGKFLSMIPIESISKNPELIPPDDDCKAYRLIEWIASEDFKKISKLKGFVWEEDAVSFDWSKRECLGEMVRVGADALPVMKSGRLEGVVERSRLLSSLIIDVAAQL